MIVTDYDYEPHRRTPYDLGLDRVVALDAEGEFMGKEKLREISMAPPNRFVTLRVEGDVAPPYGAGLTREGEDVGVLTSPAHSPRFGNLGIGIVRTDVASVGTRVEVTLEQGTTTATVDVLAIHDPHKRRPRS
jgi:glycine cleavage system aminomethyltransferase T